MKLSRYLINCNDPLKYVDHRDNDIFNYQMNNLRVVTKLQNSQNKSSSINSTSKYVGVYKYEDKCGTSINKKFLGFYDTEYEAVMIRDIQSYVLNLLGNLYKINLPTELQMNLFIRSLNEDNLQFNYLFYQDF